MKFIVSAITVFSLIGCASSTKKQISLKSFDSLEINDTMEHVISYFGSSVQKNAKAENGNENEEDWFYVSNEGDQIATLTLNTKEKRVVSIMVIPGESDPENKIDYLLKTKFFGKTFKKYKLKRCGRDYFSSAIYYISVDSGLVIKGDSNFSEAIFYSRSTPRFAADYIKLIEQCKL